MTSRRMLTEAASQLYGRVTNRAFAFAFERIYRRRHVLPKGMALVSITFDDFPLCSAGYATKLLEENNWQATYYTSPGIWGAETVVGAIAGPTTLKSLARAGHEIAAHGHGHTSFVHLSSSGCRGEVLKCQSALRDIGVHPTNFAYPFGEYSNKSQFVLAGSYSSHRSVARGINAGPIDLLCLKAYPLYDGIDPDSIDQMLGQLSANGGWLVFYTHDVRDGSSRYGCSPDYWARALKSIGESGARVLPVRDAIQMLELA
jgi:peptidoglycan/xylan/chitin deacetylase (PgdA/CDA1 family)